MSSTIQNHQRFTKQRFIAETDVLELNDQIRIFTTDFHHTSVNTSKCFHGTVRYVGRTESHIKCLADNKTDIILVNYRRIAKIEVVAEESVNNK